MAEKPIMMTEIEKEPAPESIGRNEPCPCGSGKKYKRCHGVSAPPKYAQPALPGGMPQMPEGFDPSQLDPQMMNQVSQALQKLPRPQMQKLQSIMQRAMAGKDVSHEAAEFEKTLPPQFKEMMGQFSGQLPGMPETQQEEMTPEEARAIVAQAATQGKVSHEKAEELLGEKPETVLEEEKGTGIKKFWRSLKGKS